MSDRTPEGQRRLRDAALSVVRPDIAPTLDPELTDKASRHLALIAEREAHGTAAPSTQAQDPRAEARWLERGVPDGVLKIVLEDRLVVTQSMLAAQHMPERAWGLLVGGVGCGKSTAAAFWLVRRGGGLWRASVNIATLPIGAQWVERELEALATTPALVIDDIGWKDGDTTGVLATPVQRVLLARAEHHKATLCTSNLPTLEMLRRVSRPNLASWEQYLGDERLRDRWKHMGVWHASAQDSLRRQSAQELRLPRAPR